MNCDIIGNEIINSSSYGISIKESSGFVLNYNIIQKSTYGGIHLSSSSNISVKGNVISESYYNEFNGIGIGLIDVFNISITQNSIFANVDGFSLINTSSCIFYQNNISKNSENGVYFWGLNSKHNIFKKNSFLNNYHGILIRSNNDGNILYFNNFINNSYNVERDEGNNNWDNGSIGNYWDDYTGEDNNGDGIGDTPYQIPGGNNTDRYPLMEPYSNQPPTVEIINPKEGYFHFSGIPLFPTSLNILADTVAFGGFRLRPIQVYGPNGGPDGDDLMVWFFINGEDKGLGTWNPETGYYEWQWTGWALGIYHLEVIAIDIYGAVGWASIAVWNFCFLP